MKVSQGVAVDKHYFYAISNTHISKYTRKEAKLVTAWQADRKNKNESHFKHLNSGTVVGNKLYCAHSRFPTNPNNNTVEVYNVQDNLLKHEKTIKIPGEYGSLTWIDQHQDGSWWLCYAVYGKGSNQRTKLVQYNFDKGRFTEVKAWLFPRTVVSQWGSMSCSGGSWGADGYLYVTGHDRDEAYVLQPGNHAELEHVNTVMGLGIEGQAIAWDRYSSKRLIWGIVKNRYVSQTLIPAIKSQP